MDFNLFSPCLSVQPCHLGTFCKVHLNVLFPVSSSRRCFRFLSSNKKWGKYFSSGVIENNTRELLFSPWGDFAPKRRLSLSEHIFWLSQLGAPDPTGFHGWRPGMQLNVLQRTGQHLHNKESSGPNANSTLVNKPWYKESWYVNFSHLLFLFTFLSLVSVFFIPPQSNFFPSLLFPSYH